MKFQTLSNTGKREHNEDSFLLLPERNIYMVCDGVGGAAKGEVASRLCCDTFRDFFSKNDLIADEVTIQEAVTITEQAYDAYFAEHENAKGMASTLTFISVQNNEAVIAHVGDSRIYCIRNGTVLFKTVDHSLVNDMLASGYITEEDAFNHPKKNYITRAVQGTDTPVKAAVHKITNLQPGDFFLLCTDGILESISDRFITTECKAKNEPADVIAKIELLCAEGSKDNYTCILIKLDDTIAEKNLDTDARERKQVSKRSKSKNRFVIPLVLIITIAAIGYFGITESHKPKVNNNPLKNTNSKVNKAKPVSGSLNKKVADSVVQIPAKADTAKAKSKKTSAGTSLNNNDTLKTTPAQPVKKRKIQFRNKKKTANKSTVYLAAQVNVV